MDGYEVFRVHQNLGAATAEERAERISAGLEELAKAQDFNPEDIKANEEGGVATVRYGDQLIVTINDAEAHGTGLPRKALATPVRQAAPGETRASRASSIRRAICGGRQSTRRQRC